MQSVSSRIWTRVAVSISYDDNDYTTGTSKVTTTPRAPPHDDDDDDDFIFGGKIRIKNCIQRNEKKILWNKVTSDKI